MQLRAPGERRLGLLASGRANHAGEASVSNSESYGIEATGPQNYPDTYGPAAFPGNYDSYEVGVACILAAMGAEISDTMGHKEIAPSRKIDPYFDMNAFRKGAAAGGGEETDLTGEEHKWLMDVRNALVVAGAATVDEGFQKLYDNAKTIKSQLTFTGTSNPDEGMQILYDRVRTIEAKVDELHAAAFPPGPEGAKASGR